VRGQKTRNNGKTQKRLGALRKQRYSLGRGPEEAWTQGEKDEIAKKKLAAEIRKKRAGKIV
jgi:hypothetical protein